MLLNSDEKTEELHPQTFLQFSLLNFRKSLNVYSKLVKRQNVSTSSIKIADTIRSKCRSRRRLDWTWKELVDMVKFTEKPIDGPLLVLPSAEHNKMAIECFKRILKFMGDMELDTNQTETDCVYAILATCYKYSSLRDEVYCQVIKQTTGNKSSHKDSCSKGWRLMMLITSYFSPSELLKPYLLHHLEEIASDQRRSFWENAKICLKNLQKTFQYGGRRNVPSVDELSALSKDKVIKQQVYYIAGGTRLIVDTWTTSVVSDIIRDVCTFLGISDNREMEEYALYCIVEGDPYTLPLDSDEYILDLTTELVKNDYTYYILFSRTVWFYPLRLNNQLYIEIVYNQMAPDYMDGLFLLTTGPELSQKTEDEISRIAALLHRAASLSEVPQSDDILFLLPKTLPYLSNCTSENWMQRVWKHWEDMKALTPVEAKAQCLDILQKWPLFGSSFFTVLTDDAHGWCPEWTRWAKRLASLLSDDLAVESVLAINKSGVHLVDIDSHGMVWECTFAGIYIEAKDVKDNLLVLKSKEDSEKSVSLQTEYGFEITSLIRQYSKLSRQMDQTT